VLEVLEVALVLPLEMLLDSPVSALLLFVLLLRVELVIVEVVEGKVVTKVSGTGN
jgi:hypothetical protein